MQPLKILSFGAGAIGTYIGGSLALAKHTVVFVEQPQAAELLRRTGLKLNLSLDPRRRVDDSGQSQTGQAEYELAPAQIVISDSLAEALTHGPFDVALFALKSYDTPAALEGMQLYAKELPPILCLQNGVDNEPAIEALLGVQKVIYGTVTSAVGRRGVGDIVLEKLRGVGIAAGHSLSERLVEAFNAAYLNARLFNQAADMKWSKLLTNLLANPTSAILDMTATEVFAHAGLYKLEIAQLSECLAVMQAQGISVVDLPGTPVRALALATKLPLWLSKPFLSKAAGAGRGAKMPSFHIDLHSGRGKSEVAYLHGAVVRAGEKSGVATPVNKLLTTTLLEMTAGSMPLTEFSHNPEKLIARLGRKPL
ncbi:MAG: 2-dehydropantoate 2-reductase [Chloroflexi bacterium]|nr:2-dehydropantoate 2-reductase [Chloroflexota bacterium]